MKNKYKRVVLDPHRFLLWDRPSMDPLPGVHPCNSIIAQSFYIINHRVCAGISSNIALSNSFNLSRCYQYFNDNHFILCLPDSKFMPYVLCKFQNRFFKLLLDTGASISIIRAHCLKGTQSFYYPESLIIEGLTKNTSIQTKGHITLNVNFDNQPLELKMHIIDENQNVPFDGIIGSDFFVI